MASFPLLLISLLASSQASYYFPGVDSCQFLSRIDGLKPLRVPELAIVVEDTVDIHEAALVFQRLECLFHRTFANPHFWIFGLDRPYICCNQDDDPYEFFVRNFDKRRTAEQDLCTFGAERTNTRLIFTGISGIHCPVNESHSTFHLMVGPWYRGYSIRYPNTSVFPSKEEGKVDAANRYRVDVKNPGDIRKLYELAFRLGNSSFDSSLVNVTYVKVKRGHALGELRNRAPRVLIGLIYCVSLLISVFILFLSLLSLVNVNEHYLYVMEQIIRDRVRRQRALMREGNEEGEVEEAVEQRPNRRVRLNSEERSLLGTDGNTIHTALSGRFSSLSSLADSFYSVDSSPRRESLTSSLEEVTVEPSEDVRMAEVKTETENPEAKAKIEKK